MATPIQRTKPLTLTDAQRRVLLAKTTAGDKLDVPQELVTTKDHKRLFRTSICLGPAVWLGDVADEAARLTLHSSHPRGCFPVGDKCRQIDTSDVWECVANNGETASDWVRVGAVSDTGYQPADDDLTAIAALSTADFGRRLLTKMDGLAVRAAIGAQASLTNAATLAKISEADNLPLWMGSAWPGGGSGGAANLWDAPCIQSWYGPESQPCGLTGPCADTAAVVLWQDISRYNRTMLNTSAGTRPTYVATLQNSLGGIKSANGTAQGLSCNSNTYYTGVVGDCTLWIAAKRSATTGLVLYAGSTEQYSRVSLYHESGSFGFTVGNAAATFTYSPTTSFEVIKATLRGTTVTVSVNGTALTQATATLVQGTGTWLNWLGCYTSVQGCDVLLGSYILADGSLSSTQEAAIDSYLETLWGL